MERFHTLSRELSTLIPYRIKFKDESWEMRLLNIFVVWFCPGFMTHFTTVLGRTIYFPNRQYVFGNETAAMRSLTHEVVHLLDAERWSWPLFAAGYLFPQILALGVFTFPLFGWFSAIFLIFLLPLPSPFRFYFESRAYAMDVLTAPEVWQDHVLRNSIHHFSSWSYYRMFPYPEQAEAVIRTWIEKAEAGQDEVLMRVLLVYEMALEQ